MIHRLSGWNRRLNGLPRRLALVAATLGFAASALWMLPYVWPFAAAFVFSRMLEPFVRFASRGFFRLPPSRRRPAAAALGMALLFGLTGAAVSLLMGWLVREAAGLLHNLPRLLEEINTQVVPALLNLYRRFSTLLPPYLAALLQEAAAALSRSIISWTGALSVWLTSGAWNTAASLPHLLLGAVLTVMSTYTMTADRSRIAAFFHRMFPPQAMQRSRLIRARFFSTLMGQLRSQLMISLLVTFFLILALGVSGISHGALIGLIIGVADVLPVFGVGLILIPWCLACLLTGRTALGAALAFLYACAEIIRQVLEPRLIGRQLGLHPLAAMMAMYVGLRALGWAGLLAGPVFLHLVKAVLEADQAAIADPP